jgi:shikimate kinase
VAVAVLVGLPGCGKSAVGSRVAALLAVPFHDTDEMLGGPSAIAHLWADAGEAEFRSRELGALREAVQTPAVVATGGGVVTTAPGRAVLARESCVWLDAPARVLAARVSAVARPVLGDDPRTRLSELAAVRRAWYEEVARGRVDASRSIARVVDDVLTLVRSWSP